MFLQIAGAADTVITKVVATELSTLQKVLAFAEIGAVLLAYALMAALLFAILKMARAVEAARDKVDDVRKDVRELIDNGNRILERANSIVESVKSSVEGVTDTVDTANRRAHQAVSDLADRVDDFNRTLTLVQTETQDAVVTALSAIKGVKAGVGALRGRRRPKAKAAIPPDDADGDGRATTGRPRLKRREHAES
jgi:uncharacterized protein YoxC